MNPYLTQLKSKNIHVIGVSGAEGSEVAIFLAKYRIKKVALHDFCEKKDFQKSFFSFHDALSQKEKKGEFNRLRRLPYKFYFRDEYLKNIEKANVIFVPQSWFRYPFNDKLKKFEKKLSNITKLYFNLCPAQIIAVTGTSGKSTTTRLIYEIFKKTNRHAYFTGNDRKNCQILNNIFEIKPEDILIMEISNRQLKFDLKKSPKIGVITNITPNHLDDHRNFLDYVETKYNLLQYQKPTDFAILNYDNDTTRKIGKNHKAKIFYFSIQQQLQEGAFLVNNDLVIRKNKNEYKICSINDLKIKGKHNIQNVLAASLCAFVYGVNTKIIRNAVTKFSGLKSRLEPIAEIKGVKYYEDSSACNPDGVRAAVETFSSTPLILIAGGERKIVSESEFDEMARTIVNNNVKIVLLIGKKAQIIKKAINEASLSCRKPGPIIQICKTLEEVTVRAYKSANRGDTVLLSPGCESFDMFRDYRDRARKFRKVVLALK
ncbi:MAG: UDP-N-acetylmuramoyl-L-alanine--D-glutamate ligase [Patescibacteria group bacterium]